VQLSSQKSESEAQSVFRSLQAKFPNELGDRKPIVRRADLGPKGVFYRTMVGPFASSQEAAKFCASYKAAGGQCVVPNN
jgi:SPOR domain